MTNLILLATILGAALLWPVLARARAGGIAPATGAAGVALVLVVVLGGYWIAGEPAGLDPAAVTAPAAPDVAAMVLQLEQRMAETPDDAQGWAMLARSYLALGRYPDARDAFARLVALPDGDTLDNRVDLAEAAVLVSADALDAEAGAIFEQALSEQPGHPKALWYGGIAAWRHDNAELGRARWSELLAQDPPEELAAIIRERLGEAASSPMAAAAGAPIPVRVTIAPALAGLATGEDVLFIYARSPGGGAPLAVRRLQVGALPAEILLGNADDMMGQGGALTPPLEIVARLSATGDAMPRSGDRGGSVLLEAEPPGTVEVVIDQVVP
jgi:cytochrome c-type biogenesis protein CcmH